MYTPAQIAELKKRRKRCRTDLAYLCWVLGMKDVVQDVHGYLLKPLEEPFKDCQGVDVITPSGDCAYRPKYRSPSHMPLEIRRRMLLLAYRGGLKTSINVVAHTVQWILNFPHIAVMLYHNKDDRATELVDAIREHFTFARPPRRNDLATLFPEFCLQPTPKDLRKYGSKGNFICPARERLPSDLPSVVIEPTVMGVALGTSQAGYHTDVIKYTDIVEESNSETPEALAKGWRRFNTSLNLPKDPSCFVYVEGTIYELEDTYMKILEAEWFNLKPEDRTWEMVYCPAYLKDAPPAVRFTPDAMQAPYLIAKEDVVSHGRKVIQKGKPVPHWPVWQGGLPKFDVAALEEKRRGNPEVFAKQQLLNPLEALGSMGFAPEHYREIPVEAERGLKFSRKVMSIDTAESETGESDSAILTAGVTSRGLIVVLDAVVEKLQPEVLIRTMFERYMALRPERVMIEDTPFVRGLRLSIDRELARNGMYMPIDYLPRHPGASKDSRIKGALRTPFAQGRILFSRNISEETRLKIKHEILSFPRGRRKDALDALSDIAANELDPFQEPRENLKVSREIERRAQLDWAEEQWAARIFGPSLAAAARETMTVESDWS